MVKKLLMMVARMGILVMHMVEVDPELPQLLIEHVFLG